MKLLLDTHLLLWSAGKTERLSTEARALIEALDNELFFSSASLWEVVIKRGLGRDDFKVDARLLRRGLLGNGYSELPIGSEHVKNHALLRIEPAGSERELLSAPALQAMICGCHKTLCRRAGTHSNFLGHRSALTIVTPARSAAVLRQSV